MIEVLLPRTDGGVLFQVIVVAILAAGALTATWKRPELRVLVIGSALVALGAIGVRALH